MIHSPGVLPAPVCLSLTCMGFISWDNLQNSPFHALSPQLLAFQSLWRGFPQFAPHCPECTSEELSQPWPLLTQGLHTSHCGLGSAFQQWLGSQISSKAPPGIAALPLGSLNPALLPNPIWLLVGRVDGTWMSPSAHPGVWRGGGDGDGHWDLSQHWSDSGCTPCVRAPTGSCSTRIRTQLNVKTAFGQPHVPSKALKSPRLHFSRGWPCFPLVLLPQE